ncbi:MAG: hypothetical protein K0A94_00780 [Desulfuromonadales bacterium]|nr:hypothetical protein [Desulfuromonadales bacterium]
MSCLKGKSDVKKTKAKFVCKKCDALTRDKDEVCKPEKLEKAKEPKKDGKKAKDKKKTPKG